MDYTTYSPTDDLSNHLIMLLGWLVSIVFIWVLIRTATDHGDHGGKKR